MECTNLVDSHQLLCPWFTVVFVLFCIYTPRHSVPKTDCQPRRRSILDFSEIRELDNNKKFRSTPPFCFLPSIRVDPGPYIVTSPENMDPRGRHGEIKVHRSNACVAQL